jgi:hypothetical protein
LVALNLLVDEKLLRTIVDESASTFGRTIFLNGWGFYLPFHVAREKIVLIFLFTFFFLKNRFPCTQAQI